MLKEHALILKGKEHEMVCVAYLVPSGQERKYPELFSINRART